MATAATVSGQEEHEQIGKVAGPCVMVLFGASGDLTKRKLVPALYNLVKAKLLPKTFAVVGVAFDDLTRDQFRDQVTSFPAMRETAAPKSFKWFCDRLYYLRGEFGNPATYSTLAAQLAGVDKEHGTQANYLFYLATAPKFFAPIVQQLGQAGLSDQQPDAGGGWSSKSRSGTIWIRRKL